MTKSLPSLIFVVSAVGQKLSVQHSKAQLSELRTHFCRAGPIVHYGLVARLEHYLGVVAELDECFLVTFYCLELLRDNPVVGFF